MLIVPKKDVKASNFFGWGELLTLPSWNRLATVEDGLTEEVLDNLNTLALKMDNIRRHFNKSIKVHCAYRPVEYNKLIGGSPNSAHILGKAMDWSIDGLNCDVVRKDILDNKLLESLNMRMENLPNSSWVHLDFAPVISNRFFVP
jgi:uncharacterized protein YcbK (DUF882 family)